MNISPNAGTNAAPAAPARPKPQQAQPSSFTLPAYASASPPERVAQPPQPAPNVQNSGNNATPVTSFVRPANASQSALALINALPQHPSPGNQEEGPTLRVGGNVNTVA